MLGLRHVSREVGEGPQSLDTIRRIKVDRIKDRPLIPLMTIQDLRQAVMIRAMMDSLGLNVEGALPLLLDMVSQLRISHSLMMMMMMTTMVICQD